LSGAYDAPSISVKLEAVRANAPYDKFTLLEKQFDPNDVVGRKINIGFQPPVDAKSLAGGSMRSIEALVPVLSVAGPDLTTKQKEELARGEKPVSGGGKVYDLDAKGNITIDGVVLPAASSDPKAADAVSTVAASASGSSYPRVSVRVKALDDGGKQVSKLPAS